MSNDEINDNNIAASETKSSYAAKKRGVIDPKRRLRKRILLTIVGIPPLVAAVIGLVLSYQIYASNRIMDDRSSFPIMASPKPPKSLLIYAPHCDDEVLGAAGLMYQATHHGCDVHVVVISNGDGFRIGVSRDFNKINVEPSDFVKYGYKRQGESLTALKIVGVNPDHVTFLGYPDRGMMPMLTTNWSPSTLYRSHYTGESYSPYDNSATPHAPYCGQQVLSDIEHQMEVDKPTDIFITHPSDDHPDHAADSVFVRTALDRLRSKGEPWAKAATLHYYLVHRGDWPVPQGLNEGFPLPPPAQMVTGETKWQVLPLTHYQTMRKYAAIKRYGSQTEITGRFLYSFARKNELFGMVDSGEERSLPVVADGTIRLDGSDADWRGIAPVDIDPASDSVGRAFQGSADVVRVYLARDGHNLYVRMDLRQPISSDVSYGVSLRPLDGTPNPPPYLRYVVKPGHEGLVGFASRGAGVQYVWRGSLLELQVPLSEIPLPKDDPDATIDVAVNSMFADLFVDRTGYQGVAFNPPVKESTVASK